MSTRSRCTRAVMSRPSRLAGRPEFDDTAAYRDDITSYRRITRDHEKVLGRSIQIGIAASAELALPSAPQGRARHALDRLAAAGEQAVQAMARANLPLVLSIARRFNGRGYTLADMIQDGNAGLLVACRRFDPERGVAFGTYATWWIVQAIGRGMIKNSRTVQVPVHVLAQARKAEVRRQEDKRLTRKDKIALAAVAAETCSTLVGLASRETSSDASAIQGDNDARVRAAIARLPDVREQEVLRRRFGIGCPEETLLVIGTALGLTRERIRQIETQAMTHLRTLLQGGVVRPPRSHRQKPPPCPENAPTVPLEVPVLT